MSTYVIGDVQGCFDELMLLLDKIKFNKYEDILIFAGDIVNKGPKSLEVVNFIMRDDINSKIVLGNNEIYFLALCYDILKTNDQSMNNLLSCDGLDNIVNWLSNQPFIIQEQEYNIVHAGLPHIWTIEEALKYNNSIRDILSDKSSRKELLQAIFDKNNDYSKKYKNIIDRINYFTQMRLINSHGELDLSFKGEITTLKNENNYQPWYNLRDKVYQNGNNKDKILFGHWAALKGVTGKSNYIALDDGCVFGGSLSCLCIENKLRYSIDAIKQYKGI